MRTWPKPTIEGSPENMTDAQLGERAPTVLDELYRDEIAAWNVWKRLFEARANQGRATTDIALEQRAQLQSGQWRRLLVDIDQVIPRKIDENGAVTFAERASTAIYDLVDEIASQVIVAGGRVIGGRQSDLPRGPCVIGSIMPGEPPTMAARPASGDASVDRGSPSSSLRGRAIPRSEER
jgi:hypothetical protein